MMCEKHFGSTLQLKDNYPLPKKKDSFSCRRNANPAGQGNQNMKEKREIVSDWVMTFL
jgi:hypothetical protein